MSTDPSPSSPLGVFDSGVGGLSVLTAIHLELPDEASLYLADQAHVPYGRRPLAEVQMYAESISRYLLEKGAKLIVVACNTASAAALHHLRVTFPETPFVGMEPAVKPAVEHTRSGIVGVLATPATFQGKLYASLVERFANGVTVLQQTCPGLVAQIEKGHITDKQTREILEKALEPMLEQGIDSVVLGCTHYPFVIPLIEQIVGPTVKVIDPAPAVARQVWRVLSDRNLLNKSGQVAMDQFLTSGNADRLASLLPPLLGKQDQVKQVCWREFQLFNC